MKDENKIENGSTESTLSNKMRANTLCASVGVDMAWVLPGLWEGTIVPHVPLTVCYIAQLPVLHILLDWVECILNGDLQLGTGVSGDFNDLNP